MASSALVHDAADASAQQAPPTGFNVALLVTSLWFFGGLLLDGWAHNHLDLSKEGFFTPYHAVFYTGFVALASVLFLATWRNRATGISWRDAIPKGYRPMALGAAIFALGGGLDMLWHIRFGVEQDVEALFSPTHLLLAVGGATMMSGPISAGLARANERSWSAQFSTLIALALFATLVQFFFMWAFPLGAARALDPHVLYRQLPRGALDDVVDFDLQSGIAAIVIRSLIVVGFVTWAARRLALPFGAVTMLVAVPNVLIAVMLDPLPLPILLTLASALAAGLAGDAALSRWGDIATPWRSRLFGFGLPFVFWAVYVTIAYFAVGGFWWSPHVVYGAPVIGGLCGLLISLAGEASCGRRDSNPQPTSS
jgi:hypothetical protein